jgi:hypothetical protein
MLVIVVWPDLKPVMGEMRQPERGGGRRARTRKGAARSFPDYIRKETNVETM